MDEAGGRRCPGGTALNLPAFHMEALEPRLLLTGTPITVDAALPPVGGRAYVNEITASFINPGETDQFSITVEAGQSVSVLLSPMDGSIVAQLDLVDDATQAVLASSVASEAGARLILEPTLLTEGDSATYTLNVANLEGLGDYQLSVLLNGRFESEGVDGSSNDTLAEAELLEGAFTPITDGTDRVVVLGDAQGDTDVYAFELAAGESVTVALSAEGYTPFSRELLASFNDTTRVVLADVNSDGALDVLVTQEGWDEGTSLRVMLGRGDGTFESVLTFGAGNRPAWFTVLDVNNDGHLDVVAADPSDYDGMPLLVLLGQGDGTFGEATRYNVGFEAVHHVAAGDVNNDGIADLVVSNAGTVGGGLSVLLGQGDGTFGSAWTMGVGQGPVHAVLGDVDGDGNLDVVIARPHRDTGGGGATAASVSTTSGPGAANHSSGDEGEGLGLLLGNGDGTFQPVIALETGHQHPTAVLLEDLDGDGWLDLVVTSRGRGELPDLTGGVSVFFGAAGGFSSPVDVAAGIFAPITLAATDINGDGFIDLIVGSEGVSPPRTGAGVTVLLNDGAGGFSTWSRMLDDQSALAFATGDVNGDGLLDIVTLTSASIFNNDYSLQLLLRQPGMTLELLDDAGEPLTLGEWVTDGSGASDLGVIRHFTATEAGTYYVRIEGGTGAYQLLVARNADLSTAPEGRESGAQPITPGVPVIGRYDPDEEATQTTSFIKDLVDGQGFRWEIWRSGEMSAGHGAFGTAGHLPGFSGPSTGLLEAGGREVVIGAATVTQNVIGGDGTLRIVRKIYISPDDGFARYLDIVTNTADTAAQYNYNIETWVGDGSRQTFTSSGDDALTADDLWLISDVGRFGEPAVTQIIGGAGAAVSPYAAGIEEGATHWSYLLDLAPGETKIVAHFLAQSETFDDALRKAQALSTLPEAALRGMSAQEKQQVVNFAIDALPGRHYTFEAKAGDVLTISTATAGDGPGLPDNGFNPALALYYDDGEGSLTPVAVDLDGLDGRNALLQYVVPEGAGGTYRVVLTAEPGSTAGDFTLLVEGATSSATPFTAHATTVEDGGTMRRFPATYQVTFSEPVLLSSLDAGDLTVNGQAATGFTIVDARTVRFDIASLGQGDGEYEIAIAPGAVTSASGAAVEAFVAVFTVDTQPPSVVSSSLTDGDVVPMEPWTFTATFSEAMDDGQLDRHDVVAIHAVTGAVIAAELVSYDPVTRTLQAQFNALAEGPYTLHLHSGGASLRDHAGNTIDGDGDGTAGDAYRVEFHVDVDEAAMPATFEAVGPAIGHIAQAAWSGVFHAANDRDSYLVSLEAGSRITVLLTGGADVRGGLELLGPNHIVLAEAEADAAGAIVSVTALVTETGVYRVAATSVTGTGDYNLTLTLNAAQETEQGAASDNDDIDHAQNIDDSNAVIDGVERLAVVGRTNGDADVYSFTLSSGETISITLTSPEGRVSLDDRLSFTTRLLLEGDSAWSLQPTLADVDGDGRDDLILSDLDYGGIWVLRSDGTGDFHLVERYDTRTWARQLHVADVTGDGVVDIIAATGNNAFHLLKGHGDGTFGPRMVIDAPNSDDYFELAHIVGSDAPDLIFTTSDGLVVMENLGEGHFAAPVVLFEDYPELIRAVDLNNDGRLDLLFASGYEGRFQVALNEGDGMFGPVATFESGIAFSPSGPGAPTIADVTGDGTLDLVLINEFDRSLHLLAGRGDGTFESPTTLASELWFEHVSAADVDGDGVMDLLAVVSLQHTSLAWLAGQGDGTFASPQVITASLYNPYVTTGDFNGDGLLDIATAGFNETGGIFVQQQRRDPQLRLLDGEGNVVAQGMAGSDAFDQVIADYVSTSGGTYYVEVVGDSRDYAVVVTRNASVSLNDDGSDGTGQDIGRTGKVVGSFGGSRPDGVSLHLPNWSDVALLLDAGGYIWNADGSGTVLSGSANAFRFSGLYNADAGFFTSVLTEEYGRELVFGTTSLGAVQLDRKLYVPTDGAFARMIEIYTNTGGTPVSQTVYLESTLRDPVVYSTSSGDTTFAPSDEWIVVTQQEGQPAVGLVTAGVGGVHPTHVSTYASYEYTLNLAPGETRIVMHFAVQDFDATAAQRRVEELAALRGGALAGLSPEEIAAIVNFNIDDSVSYDFNVTQATTLSIDTTPNARSDLRLSVRLYHLDGDDPTTPVAAANDPDDLLLNHAVDGTALGRYRVVVERVGGTGTYTVDIDSSTPDAVASASAFEIVATNPPTDADLARYPQRYTMTFSEQVLLTSLDPGDVLVNGVAATNVTVLDGRTLAFDISAAMADDGLYEVSIAEGAIQSVSGKALPAFHATFVADVASPFVVDSSVSQGDVLPAGPLTWTVRFNEPLATEGLGAEDVELRNVLTGETLDVVSFDYDSGTSTLTVSFGVVEDGAYALRLRSGADAFRDEKGRPLDGAPSFPLPSGDAVDGDDFVVRFAVDGVLEPIIAPAPVAPLGSLVHREVARRTFHAVNDSDAVSLNLRAGEVLTLRLTPLTGELLAGLVVQGPAGVLANVAATGAGESIILQTIAIETTGVYTINASALAGSGGYELEIVANAAIETEDFDGSSNDTIDSATSLDDTAVALADGLDRLAALGQTQSGDDHFRVTLTAGQVADIVLLTGANAQLMLLDSTGTPLALGKRSSVNSTWRINGFVAPETGEYIVRVTGSFNSESMPYQLLVTRGGQFEAEVNDLPEAAHDLLLNDDGSAEQVGHVVGSVDVPPAITGETEPNDNGDTFFSERDFYFATDLSGTLAISQTYESNGRTIYRLTAPALAGQTGVYDVDVYRLSASAGDDLSVVLERVSGDLNSLSLYDNQGRFLASGSFSSNARTLSFHDFTYSGDYYLVVSGSDQTNEYLLRVDHLDTAAPMGIFGHDVYRIAAQAGDVLDLRTLTPDVAGSVLDAKLELLDAAGNVLASDSDSLDGRNAHLTYTVTGDGVYYVRVSAEDDTQGAYVLRASRSGEPIAASGPQVVSVAPAAGQLLNHTPTLVRLTFDRAIRIDSITAADLRFDPAVTVTGMRMVDERTVEFNLSLPAEDATYSYSLDAGVVLDMQGNGGEAFTGSFTIDTVGPHVVEVVPGSQAVAPFSQITFIFSEAINTEVLFANMFRVQAPDGRSLAVRDIRVTNGNEVTIEFTPSSLEGVHTFTVLRSVRDLAHNLLDQDRDGINGEFQDDDFVVEITLQSPNLAVTQVTAPASAQFGETIALTYTVANTGSHTALEGWRDRIYLSRNTTLDGNDILLAVLPEDDERFGPLDAAGGDNDSYTRTVLIQLPVDATLTSGTYYLLVEADGLRTQPETNETDNVAASAAITLEQTRQPDLQVTGVVAPARVRTGQSVTVAWTVANTGADPATGPWVDHIYLSADGTLDQALLISSVAYSGSLGSGEAIEREHSFHVPTYLLGAYHLIVVTDAHNVVDEHDREDNNTASTAVRVFSAAGPTVQAVSPAADQPVNTPPAFIDFTFNQPIDISSLQSGDLVFSDPGVSVLGVELLDDVTVRFTLSVPDGEGAYGYALAAGAVEDLLGQASVAFTGTIAIDQTGPQVVAVTPSTQVVAPFSRVRITFSEAMDAATLTPSNFGVTAPGDTPLTVVDVLVLNDREVEVVFTVSSQPGSYTVTVTPAVADLAGNGLNQDGDATPGEPDEDAFTVVLALQSPNLAVTAIATPGPGQFGQPLDVSYTVSNLGPDAAVEGWRDRIYLSRNNTLDGDDLLLLEIDETFPHLDGLSGDNSYTRTVTVRLPVDVTLEPGTYHLIVVTDAHQTQPETNELDNFGTLAITIDAPVTADLVVSDITTPATAIAGDVLTLHWTIHNQGAAAASGTWVERIYLSSTPTFDDTLLAEVTFEGVIDAGGSVERQHTLTLPLPLEGVWYLWVHTDAADEVDEYLYNDNNRRRSDGVNVALPPLPDLVVRMVTAPASSYSNSDILVTWTVHNQGNGAATGSWTDRVLLSSDAFPGEDIELGDFHFTGTIEAGASITRTQVVSLPFGVSGDQYILVHTDVHDQVYEHQHENNNIGASGQTIAITTLPHANLVVGGITSPVLDVELGQTITISWEVLNTGDGATSADFWWDRVYLSVDTVLDSTDIRLGEARNVSALNPGESYGNTATIRITGVAEGEYYLLVRTDDADHLEEFGGESDNVTAGPRLRVTPPPPADLIVSQVNAPAQAFSGQLTAITYTVQNIGPSARPPSGWWDYIYISSDEHLSDDDVLVAQVLRTSFDFLGMDELAYTDTVSVRPPHSYSGEYYFIVHTDARNQVNEFAFEDNNTNYDATPTMILLTPPPDLETAVESVPDVVEAGRNFTVHYSVTNFGASDTPITRWNDAVYLSTDSVLDPSTATRLRLINIHRDPIVVGNTVIPGGLPVGDTYGRSVTVSTDADLAPGTYYLFIAADSGDAVFELDNDNNIAVVELTVVATPPDLAVTSIAGDGDATAGQLMTIDYHVINQGVGDTIRQSWTDRLYMSFNDVIGDDDDVLIASRTHSGLLAPGESYLGQFTFQTPFDISGPVHFYVRVDQRDQVYESDESNNVSPLHFAELTRVASDLAVSNVQMTVENGRLTLMWQVDNQGANTTNATWWYDRVILSRNGVLGDGDDVIIVDAFHSGALASGESYTTQRTIELPYDLSGTYHVFIQSDARDDVDEAGQESNNIAGAGTIDLDALRSNPNLVVHAVTAPLEAVSGQAIEVSYTVRNVGDLFPMEGPLPPEFGPGHWFDRLYLSRDQVFDPHTDHYLGQQQILIEELTTIDAEGGAYQEYTRTVAVTVPAGQTGPFYLFVVTDRGNHVVEDAVDPAGESDNVGYDATPMIVSLAPPADLVAGQITISEEVMLGGSLFISYLLGNEGDNAVQGSWTDSVFLSRDQVLSPDDILLRSLTHHNTTINPGETAEYFFGVTLTSAIAGDYYVIIRTDAFNTVPESDETNNITASLGQVSVDAQALELNEGEGRLLIDAIVSNQSTRTFYFKVEVEAGRTLMFDANVLPHTDFETMLDRNAVSALYIAYERVAGPSDYDLAETHWTSTFRDQHTTRPIIIPRTEAGTYYLRLDITDRNLQGSDPQHTHELYELIARELPFTIVQATPQRVGNTGEVTLDVILSNANLCTAAELLFNGQVMRQAVRITPVDHTRALITFDTAGLDAGEYTLRVIDHHGATDTQALTIVQGTGANIAGTFTGPSAVRDGQEYVFYINYGNDGDADGIAPLLVLTNNGSNPFALHRNELAGTPQLPGAVVQLLGISPEGLPGVLRPHEIRSIPVFARAISGSGDYDLQVITADDTRSLNFADIEADLRPDAMSDEQWNAIRPRLQAMIGETWGSYVRALSATADRMAEMGLATNDVRLVVIAMVQIAQFDQPVAMTGHVHTTEDCIPVADATLRLIHTPTNEQFVAAVNPQGQYVLRGLPSGAYRAIVEAQGMARTIIDEVVIGDDGPLSLDIAMARESRIEGVITFDPAGPTTGEMIAFARNLSRPNDPAGEYLIDDEVDGSFNFAGLEAGDYEITISRAGYLPRNITVSVGQEQTVTTDTVHLQAAASVAGFLDLSAIANTSDPFYVSAYQSGQHVATVLADANGSFLFEDLAAGDYTIAINPMSAPFSQTVDVTLEAGDSLGDIAIKALPGATLRGRAVDAQGQPLSSVFVIAIDADRVLHRVLTDAEGNYVFESLAGGTYQVGIVGAAADDMLSVDINALEGDNFVVDLAFDAVAHVEGRVLSNSGDPLQGVAVELIVNGEVIATSQTEADGSYAFLLREALTFDIRAAVDGASFTPFTGIHVDAGRHDLPDLVAGSASVTFAIHTDDDETPAAGNVVFLYQVQGETLLLVGSAAVDNEGHVHFNQLVAGDYRAEILPDEALRGGSVSFSLADGASSHEHVHLEQMHAVTGTISAAATGQGVIGAIVALISRTDPLRQYQTTTAEDGSYTLSGVAEDAYDLVVIADDLTAQVSGNITIGSDTQMDLNLSDAINSISGQVQTSQGDAVVAGHVLALDEAGRVVGIAAIQGDGSFTLEGLPTGAVRVRFVGAGFQPVETAAVALGASDHATIGVLQTESVATGQKHGDAPIVELDALEARLQQVEAEFRAMAQGFFVQLDIPSWLVEVYFNDPEHRADHVSAADIPSSSCLECQIAKFAAADAVIEELLAFHRFDEAHRRLESQATVVKALFVSELAVVAGTLATAVITLRSIIPLVRSALKAAESARGVLGTLKALNAGAGAAATIEVSTPFYVTQLLGVVFNSVSQLPGDLRSIFESEGATDAGVNLGLAALTLGDLKDSVKELANLIRKTSKVTLMDRFGMATGLLPPLQMILDAVTMQNTSDALDYYLELEQDRASAETTYNDSVDRARARLAEYLDCLDQHDCEEDDDDGSGGGTGGDDDDGDGSLPPPPPGDNDGPDDRYRPRLIASFDPNDIIGPDGFGEDNFVPAAAVLPYTIRFENVAEATAAAQRVVITHQLDADLDYRTFRVDDFGWGDLRVELPGNASFYQGRVELDEGSLAVDVAIHVDIATGLVTWTLQTVDAITGDLPLDPFAGFLPPNDEEHRGEGFVSYTIQPHRDAVTGARIDAEATIVFDNNEPIDTPAIFNTLDAVAPASAVAPLPALLIADDIDGEGRDIAVFELTWAGQDDSAGSALASFDIYVAVDGGPYTRLLERTTLTSTTFIGEAGRTYAFYSVARDNAGNVEAAPDTPDAVVTVQRSMPAPTVAEAVVQEGMAQRSYVDTVRVTFDGPTNLGELLADGTILDAVTLTHLGMDATSDPANPVALSVSQFSYDEVTHTLTWSLDGFTDAATSLSESAYAFTFHADLVQGLDGQSLDGDGDGTAGDDYTLHFHVLTGDVTGDGLVDAADQALVDSQLGKRDTHPDWNPEADTDRSGTITTRDRADVIRNLGNAVTLPGTANGSESNDDLLTGDTDDASTPPAGDGQVVTGPIGTSPDEPTMSGTSLVNLGGRLMSRSEATLRMVYVNESAARYYQQTYHRPAADHNLGAIARNILLVNPDDTDDAGDRGSRRIKLIR